MEKRINIDPTVLPATSKKFDPKWTAGEGGVHEEDPHAAEAEHALLPETATDDVSYYYAGQRPKGQR